MTILAIEQPGLLEINPPSHLNWRLALLVLVAIGAVIVLLLGQDLLFSWRNRKAAAEARKIEQEIAATLSGNVTAEVESSAARTHQGHHTRVRDQHRFRVDTRVNQNRLRGYREG